MFSVRVRNKLKLFRIDLDLKTDLAKYFAKKQKKGKLLIS